MAGETSLRVKVSEAYRRINRAVGVGGRFNATPQRQAEVLNRLKTGPSPEPAWGDTGDATCPALGKWTVRTIRAIFDWLHPYTLSGAWRLLRRWGLRLHSAL